MEFAEGGQVNDKDYIQKHGINVNEVLLFCFVIWPIVSFVLFLFSKRGKPVGLTQSAILRAV